MRRERVCFWVYQIRFYTVVLLIYTVTSRFDIMEVFRIYLIQSQCKTGQC